MEKYILDEHNTISHAVCLSRNSSLSLVSAILIHDIDVSWYEHAKKHKHFLCNQTLAIDDKRP